MTDIRLTDAIGDLQFWLRQQREVVYALHPEDHNPIVIRFALPDVPVYITLTYIAGQEEPRCEVRPAEYKQPDNCYLEVFELPWQN